MKRTGVSTMTQLPLFAPESTWQPPAMADLPSDWNLWKRVSIDVETRDDHLRELGIGVRRGGYITGISFALPSGPAHYLPIRHAGGDNMDLEQVLAYVRHQCKHFRGDVVGANFGYDLDYLTEDGVSFDNVRFFRDIQLADPLIYELHERYSLQHIAERHGLQGKFQDDLEEAARAYGVSAKSGMWRLPARYVGLYAERDTTEPLLVFEKQEKLIADKQLTAIHDLESQVLPVLVKMRRRGIRVDEDRLAKIEHWSLAQEAEALAEVRRQTGHQINVGDVWKAKAFAPALEAIGIKVELTSKGDPSIDKDFLAGVDHPVAGLLARARKVNKLRTTFAASVRKYMVNGRIHCNFNQILGQQEGGEEKGARYGRLSCDDPNMQQQPSRDEFAKEWRSIYVPEDGALWDSNDYSQQEPRWTTHFAAVMDLPGARAAAQAYHDDPKIDNHQFMADTTGLPRKFAKNIYLGLCYGEGGAKLARDCGLPTRWAIAAGRGRDYKVEYFDTREEAYRRRYDLEDGRVFEAAGEEAQKIIDTFDMRAPFIRLVAKEAEKRAKSRGYVITGGGRRLHFPQRMDGSYDWTHKALNRVIQGTGADQMKRAMVEIDKQGHFLQLQVHDEVNSSVADHAEAHSISKIMQDVMPALVPFRVDVEIGPSWGEAA